MNKKFLYFIIVVLLGTVLFFKWQSKAEKNLPLVGIIQIAEHPALNQTRDGIIKQLSDDGFVDGKNIKVAYECAQGNPALASQIAQKFIGQEADAIVCIGTTAAQAARQNIKQYGNKVKMIPLIFASVTDPEGARLTGEEINLDMEIITGVSNFVPTIKSLEIYKKILPTLKRIGVIYNPGESNSAMIIKDLQKACDSFGIELLTAPANRSADVASAAQQLVSKVDAILIDNDNTALSAFESILRVTNDHKIPVFVSDVDLVGQGAIAAYGPDQFKLGQQTGKMVSGILSKEFRAQDIQIQYPHDINLYINQQALDKLNIVVSDDVKALSKSK
jgi:putative ABC transport system substrate-binding protein